MNTGKINHINCKEITVLNELYGDGSVYCYEMFMYIYDDFIKNRELDINDIFIDINNIDINKNKNKNLNNDTINIYIHNYQNVKMDDGTLEKIINNIDTLQNKFLIIIPISVNPKKEKTGHAMTIILEFNNKSQDYIYILNSGQGSINHIIYTNKLLDYVYTIPVGYKFNIKNKNENDLILIYLLELF